FCERRHRDVDLVRSEYRDFRLMANRHGLEPDVQTLRVLLRERPRRSTPRLATAGGVFHEPRGVGKHAYTKCASFLDGINARAGAWRRHWNIGHARCGRGCYRDCADESQEPS